MAKVLISLEDVGNKSVSFLTEIEGVEGGGDGATPAMTLAMATRAMFENGMLAEAAAAALAGISEGELPSAAIIAYFKNGKNVE
jgi:hypothetical protein